MLSRASLNKFVTGFIAGFILPVILFIIMWLVNSNGFSLPDYFQRLVVGDILTHTISLCVFPNIVIFLLFNRFDFLRSSKGVLAVTIIWALMTFFIKFLT